MIDMAVCDICKQDMENTTGCVGNDLVIDGKHFKRITVAQKQCPDCGALNGFFHHFGCDQEICPCCGRQLLLCSCEDIGIEIIE